LLEENAGLNLTKVGDLNVENTGVKYKNELKNRDAYQAYVDALSSAGRYEEIIAEVDVKINASLIEQDAWALNAKVNALDSLGKYTEAEDIFEGIAKIPFDPKVNGWIVGLIINRANRFANLGQWQKALDAADLAELITSTSGNDYAWNIVAMTKVCALTGLSRTSEAASLLNILYEKRKNGYASAADAMLCANDIVRAKAIVLEALADPNKSASIISYLQCSENEFFYTPTRLPNTCDKLRHHSDVNYAFNKVARDIPDAYIPIAALRRKRLKDP
jgi:hypothetical protein